jgi:hypothetical protein
MFFRVMAGLVAGLFAGVIVGIMYLVMTVPDIDSISVSMLTLFSHIVGYDDPTIGWSFHLFNCALAGIAFGLVFGGPSSNLARALFLGLFTGLLCWLFSAFAFLPALLGEPAVTALSTLAMHPIMVGTLIGSAVFGVLLGAMYVLLYLPIHDEELRLDRQQRKKEAGEPVSASR